ncbi:MAG: hypothetical protein ACR2PR_09195 [Pseudohongiellaceae bacterium]
MTKTKHFFTIAAFVLAGIFAPTVAADDWQAQPITATAGLDLTAGQVIFYFGGNDIRSGKGQEQFIGQPWFSAKAFYVSASLHGNEFSSFHFDESSIPATLTTTITASIPPEEQVITIPATAEMTLTITPSPTTRTITNVVATATAVYHLRRIDDRGSWRAQWKANHEAANGNFITTNIAHDDIMRICKTGNYDCLLNDNPTRHTVYYHDGEKRRIDEERRLGYALVESLGRGRLPANRGQISRAVSVIVSAVYYRKHATNPYPGQPPLYTSRSPYNDGTVKWIIAALKTKDYDGNIPPNWANALLTEWKNR